MTHPSELEQQLQRELKLPRARGRLVDLARRRAVRGTGTVSIESDRIRQREIGVIQNIEHLRPQLQIQSLADSDPLEKRSVDADQTGAAELTPPRVAKGARNRHLEGPRIVPLIRRPQNHFPVEIRIPVGYIGVTPVACAGIIEANHRRHGEAALSVDDPIPLPAADHLVHPPADAASETLPVAERQLITEVRIQL